MYCNWTTAVEILDDDTYVLAENSCNIVVLHKNDAANDEERARLDTVGEFHNGRVPPSFRHYCLLSVCVLLHAGEFINRFRRGSLVMKLPDAEVANFPTLIFVR